ncbi:uncharacterized protein LOC144134639 [Amblyomma americanum]
MSTAAVPTGKPSHHGHAGHGHPPSTEERGTKKAHLRKHHHDHPGSPQNTPHSVTAIAQQEMAKLERRYLREQKTETGTSPPKTGRHKRHGDVAHRGGPRSKSALEAPSYQHHKGHHHHYHHHAAADLSLGAGEQAARQPAADSGQDLPSVKIVLPRQRRTCTIRGPNPQPILRKYWKHVLAYVLFWYLMIALAAIADWQICWAPSPCYLPACRELSSRPGVDAGRNQHVTDVQNQQFIPEEAFAPITSAADPDD